MSRRSKLAKLAQNADSRTRESGVSTEVSPASSDAFVLLPGGGTMGGGWGSNYQGANTSPNRGYVYWKDTNSKNWSDTFTRNEIARRVQWLYNHFGFARRLVHGSSKLIGFVTPQPNTPDEGWNEQVFENFMARAGSAEVYDRAGKFDFFESQPMDNQTAFRDGDLLQVLTETQSGGARCAYYEGSQIRNGPNQTDEWWKDGVRLDRFDKHIAYSVQNGSSPDDFAEISARDAIYVGNFDARNMIRPVSILAAAVVNMIDIVETRGFWKHGIKANARVATVLEQDPVSIVQAPGGGLLGPMLQTAATMPDNSTTSINWELVASGGQIPTLPRGVKAKVITDDRPSANNRDFERAVLQDCCFSIDLPFEALCDISGVTGPGIRYIMAEIKRWIMNRQYRMAKRCNRYFGYHVSKEIKAGRLPQGPPNWFRQVEWIGQADMTIDRGREGNLSVIQLDCGLTTWLDEWGAQGVFWKKRIRQRVAEVAFAKRECLRSKDQYGVELQYAEVFPGKSGQQYQPGAVDQPAPASGEPESSDDKPVDPNNPDS
jgi:capsid protein